MVISRMQRATGTVMGESLLITDGTDSFYEHRMAVQSLHDYGSYDKITAWSSSIVDAKKMLISRQARYTGLIDVLEFAEGDIGEAAAGSAVWVVMNADLNALESQLPAAKAAGIERVFVHANTEASGIAPLKSLLEGCGMKYTLMRTGSLTAHSGGAPLKIEDIEADELGELPKDDVYRFITEAASLSESEGKAFGLAPSADGSQLKEMRLAGCTRRDEVQALLGGKIMERATNDDGSVVADVQPIAPEEDAISKAEAEAKREEELKTLMARAKEAGRLKQIELKKIEDEKAAKRAERQKYFADRTAEDEEKAKAADAEKDEKKDKKPDEDPPPPPADTKPDDDKPDEPPLAMA